MKSTDESHPQLGRQIAALGVARLSTVAAVFAVTLIAARLLPEEAVGSAAVGQTVGMIAALAANGGLNIAAIYLLQRSPEERASTVRRLMALAVGACCLAVLIVLVSAPLFFGLVDQSAWALLVASASMAGALIGFEFAGALLLGLGHAGRFTLLELVRGWTSLLGVAVLLLGVWRSDAGLVLGLGLGYASAATLGLVWVRGSGLRIAPQVDRRFSRNALAFGMRGQLGNIFQFLGVRLDLLLVPALIDLRAAGIYFVIVRVSDVVGQAATAAASLVFPTVAGHGNRRSTSLTERTVRWTILVVGISAAIVALGGGLVLGTVFGPAYVEGRPALSILLLATIPLAIGRVLAADLKGRGRPGLVSASAILAVAATVVLDLLMIPALGIEGAAIASLLTYGLWTMVLLGAYRSVTRGRLANLVPRPSDVIEAARAVGRRAGQAP